MSAFHIVCQFAHHFVGVCEFDFADFIEDYGVFCCQFAQFPASYVVEEGCRAYVSASKNSGVVGCVSVEVGFACLFGAEFHEVCVVFDEGD